MNENNLPFHGPTKVHAFGTTCLASKNYMFNYSYKGLKMNLKQINS